MVYWKAESSGALQLVWANPDDFISWFNAMVVPSARQYGFRVVIEPLPHDDTLVGRV